MYKKIYVIKYMGIFVPSATLPSGIRVSNVYMSFDFEVVYVNQGQNGTFKINSHYKVFSNSTKSLPTNTRIPISITTSNVFTNAYQELYTNLKSTYPGSVDVQPFQQTQSNIVVNNSTIFSLLNLDPNVYSYTQGTSNIGFSTLTYGNLIQVTQTSNISNLVLDNSVFFSLLNLDSNVWTFTPGTSNIILPNGIISQYNAGLTLSASDQEIFNDALELEEDELNLTKKSNT